MERTASTQMTFEKNSFERKGSSAIRKPIGMNTQAWRSHHTKSGQRSQQPTYSDEARNASWTLRNNSESNAVHNMFALLEMCEDNLKCIAAYTRAQELVWGNKAEIERRMEDVEMNDRASQTSACCFSDEEAMWNQVPLDDDFITPSVIEATDDDLRAALREMHEQVMETRRKAEHFSEARCRDGLVVGSRGDKNDERLPEGATSVRGNEGNEIEYACQGLTDRIHRDQLGNLSDQDEDNDDDEEEEDDEDEDDSFSAGMSDIEEEESRNLSELLHEETEIEPGEIFRVRNG